MIYCNDLLSIRFPTFWPIEAIHPEIADCQSYWIEKSSHLTILFVVLKI
jgi:hypothetical protein